MEKKTVRQFSRIGPCLVLGPLLKQTATRIYYRRRDGKQAWASKWSQLLVHVEPCPSCRGKGGVITVSPFTNVNVSIYNDTATTSCLSWEHDGARYHVWIDRHSYTIEADPTFRRPTIYMNPPQSVRVGMDGYFPTRKLDARKHGIIDTVLAHAKRAGLFEAAIAKVKARERD
jgi:hypothetical protein